LAAKRIGDIGGQDMLVDAVASISIVTMFFLVTAGTYVWSRDPGRRARALHVLRMLLRK
jgi:hypothetical protein